MPGPDANDAFVAGRTRGRTQRPSRPQTYSGRRSRIPDRHAAGKKCGPNLQNWGMTHTRTRLLSGLGNQSRNISSKALALASQPERNEWSSPPELLGSP